MGIDPGPVKPGEAPQGEYDLPLKELLRVIKRRFWIIALVVFVVVGSAIYLSYQQTPTYEAHTRILLGLQVGPEDAMNDGPGAFSSDIQGLQQFSKTAVGLSVSRPTAEAVARRLGSGVTPEQVQQNMRVEPVDGTQAIQISYADSSPEQAKEAANAIADVLSGQIPEMAPGGSAVTASVWEEAEVPQYPTTPNKKRNAMLALVVGGVLGIGLAFLLERLDDRWRSPEEVEQVSGYANLSVIPKFKTPKVPTRR